MIKYPFLNRPMQLLPNEIHIWSKELTISKAEEDAQFALLNADEKTQANRFLFPVHKRRFIAGRGALRTILSTYLKMPAKEIAFTYNEYGKPALFNQHPIEFNLAHSDELAVFAFTMNHSIGVDIEKIQPDYTPAVAARYFSAHEYERLINQPLSEQTPFFFRLWARKEAMVKAIGKGLSMLSRDLAVLSNDENVVESFHVENTRWQLMDLAIHPDYQSALATNQTITSISHWHFSDREYTLVKQIDF